MNRMSLDEYVRYALSGVTAILAIFIFFEPNNDLGFMAANNPVILSIFSLWLGMTIYILHRALAYPVIIRILCNFFKLMPPDGLPCTVSNDQVKLRDYLRNSTTGDEKSPLITLKEWAAQVHYLYCSAWAVGVGAIIGGWFLHYTIRCSVCCVILLVTVILIISTLHHCRYLQAETLMLQEIKLPDKCKVSNDNSEK